VKNLSIKTFFLKSTLLLFAILLYGCSKPQTTPTSHQEFHTAAPSKEKLVKEVKTTHYKLNILAPKGSKIRILNIKPKYHKNMELKAGKYLIEVTKPSYAKFKKWITLNKDLEYKVQLKKLSKKKKVSSINSKNYFASVTKLEWKNTNEKLSQHYDKKNHLIWALQNSYIDYIKRVKVKHLFKDSMIIKGSPWPKLYATKHDTLIYSGNFRYKGKSLLFKKNNTITLYEASPKHSKKRKYGKLSSLKVNDIRSSWRIPKYSEVKRYNPFKEYQKYFEVSWYTYKDIKFNLPILCTKKDAKSYYTNYAFAYKYNKRSRLYNGPAINQKKRNIKDDDILLALEYSQNFALLLPVRKPSNRYDKIIFNQKLSLYKKLSRLTNLLTKESLKKGKRYSTTLVNTMASKALKMLLGDPKFAYAYYDSSRDVIYAELYGASNNFTKKVVIKVGARNPKKLKKALLDNTKEQVVQLAVEKKKLIFKSVDINQ